MPPVAAKLAGPWRRGGLADWGQGRRKRVGASGLARRDVPAKCGGLGRTGFPPTFQSPTLEAPKGATSMRTSLLVPVFAGVALAAAAADDKPARHSSGRPLPEMPKVEKVVAFDTKE